MKVNFSKAIPFVPEWNDNKTLPEAEQLKLELTPMPLGELVDCTDVLSSNAIKPEELQERLKEGGQPTPEDRAKLHGTLDTLTKFIPPYVKIISGADGFDMKDVVSYAHFSGLANEIIGKLVGISSPSKADVKNL